MGLVGRRSFDGTRKAENLWWDLGKTENLWWDLGRTENFDATGRTEII